jgi:hypothetical protein
MQKTNLNQIPGGVYPVINASQYDEGRQFQIAVYDGASAYDLTGLTVTILVGKTDGTGCAYGAADDVKGVPVVAVSGNVVTITTPIQMTAAAGDNMAELQIEDSTSIIGTLNFILRVEEAALDPNTPTSDTEIPAIERAGWEAVKHYPKIDPVNNHWLVWDVATGQWVDTGVSAGGGGVSDYNDLTSRPQINGVLLTGNRTAAALGLAADAAMTGATSGAAGSKGLVPAPAAGDQAKSLRGNGTWQAEIDTLAGLTDTTISSPTDGQVLKYDADTGKWLNSNGGGGGAGALADLSDVDLGTLSNGEPLVYDAVNGKWINGGIIPTANGGTGNADGYIRTGLVAGITPGSESTAEGYFNTVTGARAHAEGYANKATNTNAHAEGYYNTASGAHSHAEGIENSATAYAAHAGGRGNEAGYDYQTAIGKYNKNASDSLFEVGNGTGPDLANRSNAIAVKTNGRILKGAADAFPAASNLAPVEMTKTMSTQRTAGSYVYVAADDTIYKITSTIAASGTLTPGTNATAVKVGDVLTQLNSDLTVHTINQNSGYTNVNQTINAGSSYTAPADGLYSVELSGTDGSTGAIYLDSNRTKPLVLNKSSDLIGVLLPLKQGAIIYTRNTYGSYYVNGYVH